MVHGIETTMITLITTDGGYFEMAPRVWKHFGVLSGTPTEGRKTFSRMAVPLPEGVSQDTAAALIEWCQMHPLSLSPNPRPSTISTPSPLDFVRPSDRERRQYCLDGPLRAYRPFWCGLTLSQREEMLVVAKQCLIPRLQAEAELYLEEMMHQTTLAYARSVGNRNTRCARCNRCRGMQMDRLCSEELMRHGHVCRL